MPQIDNFAPDANSVPPAKGVNPSGTVVPLQIDHATGYLLASIVAASGSITVTQTNAASDANDVRSMLGQNPSGTTQACLIENSTGNLLGTFS
jgi:hypothetical protein